MSFAEDRGSILTLPRVDFVPALDAESCRASQALRRRGVLTLVAENNFGVLTLVWNEAREDLHRSTMVGNTITA